MLVDSSVLAGSERRGIHEADSCWVSRAFEFKKKHEGNGYSALKFDEAVIRNQSRENLLHVGTDEVIVIAFKVGRLPLMEHHQDAHHLRVGQRGCPFS